MEMGTLIVAAGIFVIVVLVLFRFRKSFHFKGKLPGVEVEIDAENGSNGNAQEKLSSGERSVSIGGSANDAKIVTGDNSKIG